MGQKTSESIVTYENDKGGKITITIDGENFIVEASRTKPVPLKNQVTGYIGTAAQSAWHQPTDVTIPFFWATALSGIFNSVAPQAQKNAQSVAKIIYGGLSPIRNSNDLRLAVKLLFLYYNTQLRGELLLQFGVRTYTGMKITPRIFSFGKKSKRSFTSTISKGATLFLLASVGASFRIGRNVLEVGVREASLSPFPILNAIITGNDEAFSLEHELGLDVYFKLRSYLREHPEAVIINDAELILIEKAVNAVLDFISDPKGFLEQHPI